MLVPIATNSTQLNVQGREAMASETPSVVADRGYFKSKEILACHDADIPAYVSKLMTYGAKADRGSITMHNTTEMMQIRVRHTS
jgi:hypothetical protein